jgi:hypothetical protein
MLYVKNGELWFRAGKLHWPLAKPGLAFTFKAGFLFSSFAVVEDGVKVWGITYFHPVRTFSSFIDPTYDHLEYENDHFLCFVAENAMSRKWQTVTSTLWSVPSNA